MHVRKNVHRILIGFGLALGVIATGTTVNAKAQQFNTDNYENNNSSTQQNLNNNSIQPPQATLINQYSNAPTATTDSTPNFSNGDVYQPNSDENDGQSENYSQVNSQPNWSTETNNSNNYENNQSYHNQQQGQSFNHHLNHIYNDILHHQINSNQYHVHTYHSHFQIHAVSNYSGYDHFHYIHHHRHHWFRDGLSHRNLRARSWVSWHESNHRWRVLSYGGVCVGYFQLNPHYLGYRHGHVDLRRHHQVRVADRYVRHRYGNWVNAKRFWVVHHWY